METSFLVTVALSAVLSGTPPTLPAPGGSAAPLQASPEATPPDSMNFDLLPQEQGPTRPAAADVSVAAALHRRRTLLSLHQGFGIGTTVLMAATVVVGQLNYSDRFGGGPGTGRYELLHSGLSTATTLAFATTGLLALFAPVPIAKKNEGFDTITLHKWSMVGATLGMVTEIVLGILTVSREGFANQADLATAHLTIGYATAGFLATGVGALFFQ